MCSNLRKDLEEHLTDKKSGTANHNRATPPRDTNVCDHISKKLCSIYIDLEQE